MLENETTHSAIKEDTPPAHIPIERFRSGSPLTAAIKQWRHQLVVYKNSRPSPIAAASAAESRERYRLEKKLEGKTVRPYKKHKHQPPQLGETHEDYRKRTHRDRQNSYRKTASESARTWTDLSTMSDEEKANHIKTQNRERQKKWRQGVKTASRKLMDVSQENNNGIEWGMF